MLNKLKTKLTEYQLITLATVSLILSGAFLLCLPISSSSGQWTNFIDCVFTSTSATCVTGLIVYDTLTYWTLFGQLVIIMLIQIGGIGFMTLMTAFALFIKKELSLSDRQIFLASAGSENLGLGKSLLKKIITYTLLFELGGAILLSTVFIPDFGWGTGIYKAFFHSISAFCNAGFDIMGNFASLTGYVDNIIVNLTICGLIVSGGLGFLVWSDIIKCRGKFRIMALHTKIVVFSTAILVFVSAAFFALFEIGASMKGFSVKEIILASLFQSVTTRTAGFNSIDMASLSPSGQLLTIILMFIGGSPGSTAGGIKTTTFVVLLFSIISRVKRKHFINIGKRRLEDGILHQATSIVSIYIFATVIACLAICAVEDCTLTEAVFESVSAIGTVGLTMGITPSLTMFSKIILSLLMLGGRVGMMSMVMIFASKLGAVPLERPTEKIIIG